MRKSRLGSIGRIATNKSLSCKRDKFRGEAACFSVWRPVWRDPEVSVFPERSRIDSAHIGQDCFIHYRWHAQFGRRLRLERVEQYAGNSIAFVEVQPGLIIKISAWNLDPVGCAGMEIGTPRASLAALSALHNLLVAQGFRRCSCDDRTVLKEKRDATIANAVRTAEHELAAQHPARCAEAMGFEPGQRAAVVGALAKLLLEAVDTAAR